MSQTEKLVPRSSIHVQESIERIRKIQACLPKNKVMSVEIELWTKLSLLTDYYSSVSVVPVKLVVGNLADAVLDTVARQLVCFRLLNLYMIKILP